MDNEGQWEGRPFAVPTHPCLEAYFSFPLQRWAIRRYLSSRVDKVNARPTYWYGMCALPCPAPRVHTRKTPKGPETLCAEARGHGAEGLNLVAGSAWDGREVCRPPSYRPLPCLAGPVFPQPSTLNGGHSRMCMPCHRPPTHIDARRKRRAPRATASNTNRPPPSATWPALHSLSPLLLIGSRLNPSPFSLLTDVPATVILLLSSPSSPKRKAALSRPVPEAGRLPDLRKGDAALGDGDFGLDAMVESGSSIQLKLD